MVFSIRVIFILIQILFLQYLINQIVLMGLFKTVWKEAYQLLHRQWAE